MMNTENVTGQIKQQANSSAVELSVPKTELDHEFNKYWAEVKDVLTPNLVKAATKGGYRTVTKERVVKAAGGVAEFFKPVLADLLQSYFDRQEKQPLTINDVTCQETVSSYTIQALVHLEPEVIWKKMPGIDEPLVVSVPKLPDGIIDRMVDNKIAQAREDAVILVPVDSEVSEGQVIVLDCESLIDGKKWDSGTFTNNKWLVVRQFFRIPEMMDAVIGMKTGETKTLQAVLNDNFAEDVRGKTVNITMKINQVLNRDKPGVDDDLAKTYGFNDLDAYKKGLMEQCSTELENGKRKMLMISATSKLMNPEVVDIEPIPFTWMAHKAKELYGEGRATVKTEEEFIMAFAGQTLLNGTPVTDKGTLLTFLAEKSAQQLVFDLVVRSWGRKKGVAGNSTLGNLAQYVELVKDEIFNTLTIEEYEVQEPVQVRENVVVEGSVVEEPVVEEPVNT